MITTGFTFAGIQARAGSSANTTIQISAESAPPASPPLLVIQWLTAWSNPRAEAACMVLLGLCLLGAARLRETAHASGLTVVPIRREAS